MTELPLLFGIDFSSAPSASKPVMVAAAQVTRSGSSVTCNIKSLFSIKRLIELQQFLESSPPWVAAIDMPFGLSRQLIDVLQWPGCKVSNDTIATWDTWAQFYTALERSEIRAVFKAWCDAHPPGHKFAHRASDRPARSSPSMKWVNPPVAYMLHAGARLLLDLDARIPRMRPHGRADRIALEAYPGFLARQLLGTRSYKNDDERKQTDARERARHDLINSLSTLAPDLTLQIHPDIQAAMQHDGKGDALDAVLCVIQAVLAWMRDPAGFDLAPDCDPLEGWIVNVPWRDAVQTADAISAAQALNIRHAVYASLDLDLRQRLRQLGADVPEFTDD